jgi:hypothetical protein
MRWRPASSDAPVRRATASSNQVLTALNVTEDTVPIDVTGLPIDLGRIKKQ